MNERDLYIIKLKAQLYDWQIHLDKLEAEMAGLSIGAKYEINQHIALLESKIREGKLKLEELAEATDQTWDAVKASVDESWKSITETFGEAYKEFMD